MDANSKAQLRVQIKGDVALPRGALPVLSLASFQMSPRQSVRCQSMILAVSDFRLPLTARMTPGICSYKKCIKHWPRNKQTFQSGLATNAG